MYGHNHRMTKFKLYVTIRVWIQILKTLIEKIKTIPNFQGPNYNVVINFYFIFWISHKYIILKASKDKNALTYQTMDKSWLGNVVEEIRLDYVELSCVKHEANRVAHLLASLSFSPNVIGFESLFSDWITLIYFGLKNKIKFQRYFLHKSLNFLKAFLQGSLPFSFLGKNDSSIAPS